jgi:hypothetical protein
LDCLSFGAKPSRDDVLKGYVGISRAKNAEDLLIAQPFAPMLFRQGPLPGPKLLVEFLRGCRGRVVARQWRLAESHAPAVPAHARRQGRRRRSIVPMQPLRAGQGVGILFDLRARELKQMRCLGCRFPSCSVCGQRAQALLNSMRALQTLEDKLAYACSGCLYKPCSGCGAEPTHRQKALRKGEAWTCGSCKRIRKELSQSAASSDSAMDAEKEVRGKVCGDRPTAVTPHEPTCGRPRIVTGFGEKRISDVTED